MLQLDEKQILEAANQILILAKNFDEIFGQNNNLKKYSMELFSELENFRQTKQVWWHKISQIYCCLMLKN